MAPARSLSDRLLVLSSLKILLCVPEKNADSPTALHAMAHVASGGPTGHHLQVQDFWWKFSASQANMSWHDVEQALHGSIGSDSWPAPDETLSVDGVAAALNRANWRSTVVWRDPVERFKSAYASKCLHGDHDGRAHCQRYFGLMDKEMKMEAVIKALKRKTLSHSSMCDLDPHWAPQACFCGGLESDFARYSMRIHTDAHALASGIDHLLANRVPSQLRLAALAELGGGTVIPERKQTRTVGVSSSLELTSAQRAELHALYARDYVMLRSTPDWAFACLPEHEEAMQHDIQLAKAMTPVSCTIATLVRDEAAFIAEWIEHHVVLGVGRFVLYDDDSTDGTLGVLRPYIEAGLVVLHHVRDYCIGDYEVNRRRTKNNNFIQQAVMVRHAANVYSAHTRWFIFTDVDEYVLLHRGVEMSDYTITDVLEAVAGPSRCVGGVRLFGALVAEFGNTTPESGKKSSFGGTLSRPLLVSKIPSLITSHKCAVRADRLSNSSYGSGIHGLQLTNSSKYSSDCYGEERARPVLCGSVQYLHFFFQHSAKERSNVTLRSYATMASKVHRVNMMATLVQKAKKASSVSVPACSQAKNGSLCMLQPLPSAERTATAVREGSKRESPVPNLRSSVDGWL